MTGNHDKLVKSQTTLESAPILGACYFDSLVNAYAGNAAERAYEMGLALLQIKERRLFESLGFDTFELYLASKKLTRTVAYTNMRISQDFDVHTCEHYGIGKIRLLARKGVDLERLKSEGIPVQDAHGDWSPVSLEACTVKQLRMALKTMPPAGMAAAPLRSDADTVRELEEATAGMFSHAAAPQPSTEKESLNLEFPAPILEVVRAEEAGALDEGTQVAESQAEIVPESGTDVLEPALGASEPSKLPLKSKSKKSQGKKQRQQPDPNQISIYDVIGDRTAASDAELKLA